VATNWIGGGRGGLATLQGTNSTNSLVSYPAETINGLFADVGNSGYDSDAKVAALLTNQYASGSGLKIDGASSPRSGQNYLIAYASCADVGNVTNAGAIPLRYNGTAFSSNAVIQGQYTLWGYAHLYYSSLASSSDINLANDWATTLLSTPTSKLFPAVNINDMQSGRNGDGQIIYSNY